MRSNWLRIFSSTSQDVNVEPPISSTDVAFSPAGDIFISDGYINSRIAKADKDGNWIKSWGKRGNNPGEFNTPHNIVADSQGRIYVADRGK